MKTSPLLALLAPVLTATGCDAGASGDAGGSTMDVASIEVADLVAPGSNGSRNLFVEIQNAAGQTLWRSGIYPGEVISQSVSFPGATDIPVGDGAQRLAAAAFAYGTSFTDSQRLARSLPFTADELAARPFLPLGAATGTGRFTVNRYTAAP